ncbi:hypothetical protein GCM10023340_12650 [Nocardioides marinquilinus]|uniref:N-acetyltransferase domain-containing protein n=1 Tax=Nocardioides marinquilinus TaxID=1210400 RepID=A0ABP9PD37_9ACTN
MGGLTLPELTTGRLRLRPASEADLPSFEALNGDPEVMRFVLGRAATPEETRAEWRERLTVRTDAGRGLGYWVGEVDGAFVGWWSASSFADDDAVAGLGYRLVRSAWGRGLATEGAMVVRDHAFTVPGVGRVVASTMAVNTGSRRVLEKAGLRHVDTWVGTWDDPLPGAEEGEVEYAAVRPVVLTTERLRLEPLRPDHAELLVELDADPAVLHHIFRRALAREEVLETFLPRRLAAGVGGLGFWAGFEGEEFVGWWCLIPDDGARSAEIGYRLRRAAWGRGLATEGGRALVRHALDVVRLERLWADTARTNTGSQQVLTKLGLRLVGPQTDRFPPPHDDLERDDLRYELGTLG